VDRFSHGGFIDAADEALIADRIKRAVKLSHRTLTETGEFLKALIEQSGDRSLVFITFGAEAGEIMAAVQIGMAAGLH
jgi:hypothetical protein